MNKEKNIPIEIEKPRRSLKYTTNPTKPTQHHPRLGQLNQTTKPPKIQPLSQTKIRRRSEKNLATTTIPRETKFTNLQIQPNNKNRAV